MLSLLSLSSCIEIIDDLSLNSDGSGTFKYNINLSSSKVKINSILALDSLDGKKVPSINEISFKINRVIDSLELQDGISNVTFESDYDNFLFKLKCDFSSLENLQMAIKNVIKAEVKGETFPELEYEWIHFEDDTLSRSVPQITIKKASELKTEDIKLLQQGKYTSITRFDKEIVEFENISAVLSKSKKAIMVKTDAYSLIQFPNLLDNSIYLVKSEK
jgi:hypothetical protein